MKGNKYIQSFNEHRKNSNISDVSDSKNVVGNIFASINDARINDEDKEIFDEIVDIFSDVEDYNLYVYDVYRGNSLSVGDKDIIDNHQDFELSSTFKSISIRLKPKEKENFYFDEELYIELKDALNRVESYLDLELNSIYLRTFDGIWFNSVDVLKKYIDELPFAKKLILRHILYIDFRFKDLNNI